MCEVTKDTSDGWHTFGELYAYRAAYNAGMANMMNVLNPGKVVKSLRHHDGEECFGGTHFIVVMDTPFGQVSNHYKNNAYWWDMFKVPEVRRAPDWDGHTPQEALERLTKYAWHFEKFGFSGLTLQ